MIEFTVAIRTYNGADKIPVLLEQLQAQTSVEMLRWEIVIIDNNSTDQTATLIQQYQTHWQANCELRYIFEPQQGAAIARRRAIQEARGTLIGFLDDDNLPNSDWVAAAYAFGQLHPQAGAYGSKILPQYEVEPPPNFRRIAHYLPTMERKAAFQYDAYQKGLPVGAGLVIRRQVWLDQVSPHQVIQGPVGKGFALKGEETEGLCQIQRSRWEIWYNPAMTITHYIPKWRLEQEYLLHFFRIIGLSQHRFRMLRFPVWQRPLMFPLLLLNDLRKIAVHAYQLQGSTDLVAACELQFLIGRLFSPFYIWKMLWITSRSHPVPAASPE
jgi:glycosyltransferase involved in cell wall biosynthesis